MHSFRRLQDFWVVEDSCTFFIFLFSILIDLAQYSFILLVFFCNFPDLGIVLK